MKLLGAVLVGANSSRMNSLPQVLHFPGGDLSALDHRQVQALLFGAVDSDLVTGIGVAHDACGRVVVQNAGDALGGFVSTVADDDHARVLREAHAHAATVVQRNPGRAAGGVEQGVEQRPVGHCVGAVLHGFGFAVRACHRAGVQVVTADHDRCRQLAAADHFVKGQAQLGALAQANPADTGWQALERNTFTCHVQPVVQVCVVRDQLFDLGVGLVDVFGVARQCSPAERANATAEQRTDVSRYEAREIEGVVDADFLGHLADVVAVVEGRDALFLERQHGFNVLGHGLLGGLDHGSRLGHRAGAVLFPGPASGQVAVEWVVGAGLVGDHVRAHATADHFRQDFCRVAAQGDGDGLAFCAVFLEAGEGVVQIHRLLIDIAGFQTEIDAALLAFDVQRAGTGQGCGQWLCAAHAAQACSQNPTAFQAAVVVLATGFDEGFIGALNNALAADVDPAAGGHLAVHGQALGVQFVEVFPARPVWHQVGVGDQYARGVTVGLEHADRLAGLHQQSLVVIQVGQAFDDLVVAFPVTRRTTDTTVNHQFFRVLGNFRVEVVHQHAQRRFGQPALGGQLVAAGGTDFNVTVLRRFIVSHEKDSSAINPNQPGQWAREPVREARHKRKQVLCADLSDYSCTHTHVYLYIQAYAIKRPT